MVKFFYIGGTFASGVFVASYVSHEDTRAPRKTPHCLFTRYRRVL